MFLNERSFLCLIIIGLSNVASFRPKQTILYACVSVFDEFPTSHNDRKHNHYI